MKLISKQVLLYWHQSTPGLTVSDVIDRVNKWLKNDVIDREIWTEIQPLVDFEFPGLPELTDKPKIPPKPKHLKPKRSARQLVPLKPKTPPKPKHLKIESSTVPPVKPAIPPKPKGSTRQPRPQSGILQLPEESKTYSINVHAMTWDGVYYHKLQTFYFCDSMKFRYK